MPNRSCKRDPAFRTKPQIALTLIERAQAAGIPFRAVVADCFYGDNDELGSALFERGIPHVLARRGRVGQGWAPADVAHSFEDAAWELPRQAWQAVIRWFRDGHTEVWWAAELRLFGYGPDRPERAVVATADPQTLPPLATWYLSTNLPIADAPLAEIVRLYGLRHWVEQNYKQMKDELGWADFMVRSDRAIRRHWALVCCAFSFCWWHAAQQLSAAIGAAPQAASPPPSPASPAREKNQPIVAAGALAAGAASRARLAGSVALARILLASVEPPSAATGTGRTAGRRHHRSWTPSLPSRLTNYR